MPDLSARGAANPQTIRAHIDLVEDLARQMHDGRWLWDDDADGFFAELHRRAQEIEQHAVAALNLTGEMETRLRSVIEYLECAGDPPCAKSASASCDECSVRWDCEHLLATLVPVPAPRGDAE